MCRGKEKVKAEAVLLAIGYNIEKLHKKIQSEITGTHLFDRKKRALFRRLKTKQALLRAGPVKVVSK